MYFLLETFWSTKKLITLQIITFETNLQSTSLPVTKTYLIQVYNMAYNTMTFIKYQLRK